MASTRSNWPNFNEDNGLQQSATRKSKRASCCPSSRCAASIIADEISSPTIRRAPCSIALRE